MADTCDESCFEKVEFVVDQHLGVVSTEEIRICNHAPASGTVMTDDDFKAIVTAPLPKEPVCDPDFPNKVKISKLRSGEAKPYTVGELLHSLPDLRKEYKEEIPCLSDEPLPLTWGQRFNILALTGYLIIVFILFIWMMSWSV